MTGSHPEAPYFNCQAIGAYDGTSIDTLSGGTPNKEIEGIAWFGGQLYAGGGQNNTNSFIARYNNTSSLEESTGNDLLEIFPNPSQGQIQVSAAQPIKEVKIFNTLGQLIESVKPDQNSCEIRLTQKGQYILVISTENEIYNRMILNE